jgi:hypothetical protein
MKAIHNVTTPLGTNERVVIPYRFYERFSTPAPTPASTPAPTPALGSSLSGGSSDVCAQMATLARGRARKGRAGQGQKRARGSQLHIHG